MSISALGIALWCLVLVVALDGFNCRIPARGHNRRRNGCLCSTKYEPVQAADGRVFANACVASCQGAVNCTSNLFKGTGHLLDWPMERFNQDRDLSPEVIHRFVQGSLYYVASVHLRNITAIPAAGGSESSIVVFNAAESLGRHQEGRPVPVAGGRVITVTREGDVYMGHVGEGDPHLEGCSPNGVSLMANIGGGVSFKSSSNDPQSTPSSGGPDDRQMVTTSGLPFKAVGRLEITGGGIQRVCTGTLVAPNVVLTAAHCVYDPKSQTFAEGGVFIPAQNGSSEPLLRAPMQFYHFYRNFVSDHLHGGWDIAVVRLDPGLGADVGHLEVSTGCALRGKMATVSTAGYPGDKPSPSSPDRGKVMYQQPSCPVFFSQAPCDEAGVEVDVQCTVMEGQSGSPLIMGRTGAGKWQVVAVVSGKLGSFFPMAKQINYPDMRFIQWSLTVQGSEHVGNTVKTP